MVGKKHHGTVGLKQADITVDKNTPVGGTFIVDMRSISSEDLTGDMKAMLEKHLKSPDFFNVDTFPTARLVVTKLQLKSGKTYTVSANLTIKDKTNPITFEASIDFNGKQLKAQASQLVIDRAKWDVRYGSTSFFKGLADKAIKDEMTFDVSIEAEVK